MGDLPFCATELGSMKCEMEEKNRILKNEESQEKVEDD